MCSSASSPQSTEGSYNIHLQVLVPTMNPISHHITMKYTLFDIISSTVVGYIGTMKNNQSMCYLRYLLYVQKVLKLKRRLLMEPSLRLEGDCGSCKALLSPKSNTGYPCIGVGVEALEDAQKVLLLSNFCWRHTLQLLAKVVSTYLCISTVEEEEYMLLLILEGVELASTNSVGFICKGCRCSQVRD